MFERFIAGRKLDRYLREESVAVGGSGKSNWICGFPGQNIRALVGKGYEDLKREPGLNLLRVTKARVSLPCRSCFLISLITFVLES
jgi:hypothetical protein